MSTIPPTNSATGSTAVTGVAAAAAAAAAANDSAGIGDRFLKLLVTQLKNQDPMNPMDNAQMTSQLAQISTVTGINKLNDTISALSASLGSNQYIQAAGLVGHHVLVPGNKMQLVAGAAAAGFNLASDADKVTVTINDAAGQVVRVIDMGAQGAGAQRIAWDGLTDSGAKAAEGQYVFTVKASQGATQVNADALMSGLVDGVVLGSDGRTQIQLGRLGRADLAQIIEIN
jgi:flagellar basal-body rod modification protein FlgD